MKRNGEYAHSQFVSRVYHDFISNFCAKPFLSSEITTTQRPTWGVSACTIIGFKPQMRSVAFCLFAPRSTLTKRIKFLLAVETKVQNNSKNKRQTTCFFFRSIFLCTLPHQFLCRNLCQSRFSDLVMRLWKPSLQVQLSCLKRIDPESSPVKDFVKERSINLEENKKGSETKYKTLHG